MVAQEKAVEACAALQAAMDAIAVEVGELDALYAFTDELQALVTKWDRRIDELEEQICRGHDDGKIRTDSSRG